MPESTTDPRRPALADALLALDEEALAALDRVVAALVDPARIEPVVRARRFEVLDDAGRARAVLGDLRAGSEPGCSPGLALRSAAGSERAVLVLDGEGPGLHFALDGDDALSLGVDDPDTQAVQPGPYLELFTPDGAVAQGWRLADDRVVEHRRAN
ncbi:MAG TPA: hypothetical protein VFF24_03460 [Acidimicrobiia bacterium]|nr:hypothetical protein [Acidimicrobiia bacterium]